MKCNETSIVYGCTYKFSNCDTVDETEGNMNFENNQETKKEKSERDLSEISKRREKKKKYTRSSYISSN